MKIRNRNDGFLFVNQICSIINAIKQKNMSLGGEKDEVSKLRLPLVRRYPFLVPNNSENYHYMPRRFRFEQKTTYTNLKPSFNLLINWMLSCY